MAGVLMLLTAAVTGAGAVTVWLPDVDQLRSEPPDQTSYMRLRARELGLAPDAYRVDWVELEVISPVLVCAVVKAEDRGFFRHDGFEWSQVRRAAWLLARGESRMGGSTISQQVARNLFLSPERSVWRKLREALITWELERNLTKREIVELHLNVIEWGEGVWGAKQASRHYFGKDQGELDVFESAFMAGIIAAPRQPLAGTNRMRVQSTMRRVLNQLYASHIIDQEDWQQATLRSADLFEDLEEGMPADVLVERMVSPGGLNAGSRYDRFTIAQALSGECGLEQELQRGRDAMSAAGLPRAHTPLSAQEMVAPTTR